MIDSQAVLSTGNGNLLEMITKILREGYALFIYCDGDSCQ